MLAFVLYYRSSAKTSSRTNEQAVDYDIIPNALLSATILHTLYSWP